MHINIYDKLYYLIYIYIKLDNNIFINNENYYFDSLLLINI